MSTFRMPDLGEGLPDAEIVAWHVSEGDHVTTDQPLVSVETAKAVIEIPSPQAGRIARRFGALSDRIAVGAPLVEFEEGASADTGTVVGTIPQPRPTPPPTEAGPPGGAATTATATPIRVTPAVRALARRLGVDLSAVMPSGNEGQITAADVERAAEVAVAAADLQPHFEPLRGVRYAMARSMAGARDAVAPATLTDDADIEDWAAGTDVMVRLIHAMAAACTAEPALNAWFDGQRMARRLHTVVDLGIAMDTPDGLFVPVLRDVGRRAMAELRQELDALRTQVKTRGITPEALRGQTITLSNFGMLGGRHASLVMIPPQVAIVGAGRIAPQVVALEGQPAVRRMLPLSLTFDHRAVTGGEAARFMAALVRDLRTP
jgi:2-oxoisovalerate dehydrogenase E2 component (dihydrolipoyl transacylase)